MFDSNRGLAFRNRRRKRQITQSPEIIRKKRSNTIKTDGLVMGGGPARIGEAAGVAAAISYKLKKIPRELEVKKYRKYLEKMKLTSQEAVKIMIAEWQCESSHLSH